MNTRLKDGGVFIDWASLTDIKAWLYSDAQKAIAGRCDVSINQADSTKLVCTYSASKPQYLGVQRLIVQARYMGQTKTYDKPVFNFVWRTADQEGEQITIDDPVVDVDIVVEDTSSSILDAILAAAIKATEDAEHAAHLVPLEVLQDCEQATEEAREATEEADAAAEHATPYIGENGHWWRWSKTAGAYVDTGEVAQGPTGNGIQSVEQTQTSEESEGENVVTVTMTDGTQAQFTIRNGKQGAQGIQGVPGVANAKYKQVDTLPTAGADTMDFIFLTPSQTAGVYDMSYTEQDGDTYIWKELGTTAIQLSDYATKAEATQLQEKVDDIERVIDTNAIHNLFDKTKTQVTDSRINGSGNIASQTGANVSYKIPVTPGKTYARYYVTAQASNCYVRFLDSSDNKLKPLNPADDTEIEYSSTGVNGLFKAPATAAYFQFCINFGSGGNINEAVVIESNSLPSPLVYIDGPYAKVAPGYISTDKLANGAVTGEKIANDSIPAGKLLAGAVIGGNIAPNAVGETNIVNGAISQSKLSNTIKVFKNGTYDHSDTIKEVYLLVPSGGSVYSLIYNANQSRLTLTAVTTNGEVYAYTVPSSNGKPHKLVVYYSTDTDYNIGDIVGFVVFSDYVKLLTQDDGSAAHDNLNYDFCSKLANFPILSSYKLLGKSIIFTGDSICQATTDFTNGGGWAKRIGENNGMKWENKGISGGTLIDKDLVNSTFTISDTDFGTGADYIILEGGVNDADKIGSILNGNTPALFGSYGWTDYQSIFTNATFCGALEKLIKGVVSSFPDAKVGFIIPMKMGVELVNGYQKENNNRRAYFETIVEICRKWGVPVLNLWDNCTMNPDIASHYTSGDGHLYVDGVHPTGYGYNLISPIIEEWIKSL